MTKWWKAARRPFAGVLLALTVVFGGVAAGVAPAAAQTNPCYPPPCVDITISINLGDGQVFEITVPVTARVHFQGFEPLARVVLDLRSTPRILGVGTADASGAGTMDVVIAADTTAGTHTLTATGLGANHVVRSISSTIKVKGTATEAVGGSNASLSRNAGDGSLSDTGEAVALAAGFLAILVVGTGAYRFGRRRGVKVSAAD
jgi:hypothetical protein